MAERTVEVDRDVCIGSGMCVVLAPAVFEQDDDARPVLVGPPSTDPAATAEAVEGCPTRALRWVGPE